MNTSQAVKIAEAKARVGSGFLRPRLWPASALLLASCVLASCAQTSPPPSSANASPIGPDTLNVADAAIAGGDPNMALSVSQSVLATDQGNVDALEHEGDAYYALGRCPAAEAAYQLALDHDAKATVAETGLGRCLLKTDPHDAETAFELAVQDDPGNAAALNDLGIARDLQGNFAGAVEPYQRALLANPSLTAAEVNLGLSLALSGHGPEALQYLGPLATSLSATPKIREDYAAALIASGRADEAKQVLAVDLPPDEVVAAMNGFSTVIAQSQMPPPPVPPPAPTATSVPIVPVTTTPDTHITAATPQAAPVAAAAGLCSRQFNRRLYRPVANSGNGFLLDTRTGFKTIRGRSARAGSESGASASRCAVGIARRRCRATRRPEYAARRRARMARYLKR